MAKRVRRQHIVSQFYLKGFANEANQLRRVVLPGDYSHLMATSDATVIKDFYNITLPSGEQSDLFERLFNEQVEQPAHLALKELLGGKWPLPDEERGALASWIALQHLRVEGVRLSGIQHKAHLMRLIVGVSGKEALRKVIKKAEGRSVSDAELDWEWQDITKPSGPDLVPDSRDHLRILTDLHHGTTHYLFDSHWTIIRFERRSLLTTDHPVVMTTKPDHPSWMGVGLATADGFLTPLSRRTAGLIQPWYNEVPPGSHGPGIEIAGTTGLAKSFNQQLAARAMRHIYMHPEDALTEGLQLPAPNRPQWKASNADNLISEDGLFHGMSDDQLKAVLKASPLGEDDDNNMSIDDLPWPIPNRVTSNRPRSW